VLGFVLLGVLVLCKMPGYSLAGMAFGTLLCIRSRHSQVEKVILVIVVVYCTLILLVDAEMVYIPWWLLCLPLASLALKFLIAGV
jgi:hypothetical protein